jgi:arsenate reductase
MASGTVKYFNSAKGFGFILPDGGGGDVFVHATAVEQAGLPPLVEGQRLTYETEPDPKGAKAVNLVMSAADGASATPSNALPSNGRVVEFTIYHNPDCQNSLNTLLLLRTAGHEPRIVEYLKQPPTKKELGSLVARMKLSARDVIRKAEPLYLELGLDRREVNDDALLDAMVQNPVLLNRPIVAVGSSARLCRPSKLVTAFIAEVSAS